MTEPRDRRVAVLATAARAKSAAKAKAADRAICTLIKRGEPITSVAVRWYLRYGLSYRDAGTIPVVVTTGRAHACPRGCLTSWPPRPCKPPGSTRTTRSRQTTDGSNPGSGRCAD